LLGTYFAPDALLRRSMTPLYSKASVSRTQ
jgi:hypothetical protein